MTVLTRSNLEIQTQLGGQQQANWIGRVVEMKDSVMPVGVKNNAVKKFMSYILRVINDHLMKP
ncbi:unnamed protein product [Dibothriocephalus latus]|uniref:Uncharacterized protein n=1 Tax=Dibothriocephalus latus TaxID=60516 RepID=A0A3P7NL28_DIBLA|nr:unnamed protein product [Dibothriocephalus latus]